MSCGDISVEWKLPPSAKHQLQLLLSSLPVRISSERSVPLSTTDIQHWRNSTRRPSAMSVSSETSLQQAGRFGGKRKRSMISCFECHRRKQKCDRLQPCSNCTKRGMQSRCEYEDSKDDEQSSVSPTSETLFAQSQTSPSSLSYEPSTKLSLDSLSKDLGYSTHHDSNTLGILRTVATFDSEHFSKPNMFTAVGDAYDALSKQYSGCIRNLPSRSTTDALVDIFFAQVSCQYEVVDEITFRSQLADWRAIPYAILLQGPRSLTPDTCFFPALLLQVLAHGLLCLPTSDNQDLEHLKYAPGMTFHNVAEELSDAGDTIINLLKRAEMSLVTIQADFLRAWYLKCTGSVVDAWHAIATCVRNAEEIGLHLAQNAPEQQTLDRDAFARSEWDREMRRRMWFMLHLWDVHMAVLLGRPMLTNPRTNTLQIPNDYKPRQQFPYPTLRTTVDPPGAFTVILIGYHAAYKYLPRIYELGNSMNKSEDYVHVEEVDHTLSNNLRTLPVWCRAENPDLKFDKHPACLWLPAAREMLVSEVHLSLVSLHRPYIFSHQQSRVASLTAANKLLRSQCRLLPQPLPGQYMSFTQVFTSFDALVLALSIHMLFPDENQEKLDLTFQNTKWGINRLGIVGQQNKMAKTAYGIVCSLRNLLVARLSLLGNMELPPEVSSAVEAFQERESTIASSDMGGRQHSIHVPSIQTQQDGHGSFYQLASQMNSVAPPQPLHDLFFQNLSSSAAFDFSGLSPTWDNEAWPGFSDIQFECSLPNDSFWTLMSTA